MISLDDINNLTGKWNVIYQKCITPINLGSEQTYKVGMEFLNDCNEVEDWGGGTGYAKKYCLSPRYEIIDGSLSKNNNIIQDLRNYKSKTEGIFMRHVLDHNPEWKLILNNALNSFTKKFCLIIGGKFRDETKIVNIIQDRGISNIEFKRSDIEQELKNFKFGYLNIDDEPVFFIEK